MKKRKAIEVPELSQLEEELSRVKYQKRYKRVLTSTVSTLIVVAAVAVLIATLLMPVLQIYGTSMSPTLYDGDIIATIKTTEFEPGDVVAFYYNNKILVKRVIAMSGQWVDMDEDGNVYVNDVLLDEPYLVERAFGECDIKLPYQVPENRIFVMGDHRSVSVDSRSTTVGCVAEEQLVGKLVFRVWPLKDMGPVM
ncbi:MAG: signal peptidase I [Lachnospiraceae bacterium]|uniref:signal peptidase I n=1 Tax=Candidatus Merdisoma sp. JLR.KK011 TaxID=3114299 RepID=UPI001434BD9A|nr:signal peptidase I [Lachnospiraceae bacterium]MCI9251378.1 signal peptidase I [Lachnospiraceae bacterium]MCI9382892.1 signal peptidase I [Lachnospiraceae bacterium]MCI9477812.1 signal peptidase I [Lachnospiraceae bacterium]MCI9622242.1 signal peptidase I [Lachnospiraceae bacterium]